MEVAAALKIRTATASVADFDNPLRAPHGMRSGGQPRWRSGFSSSGHGACVCIVARAAGLFPRNAIPSRITISPACPPSLSPARSARDRSGSRKRFVLGLPATASVLRRQRFADRGQPPWPTIFRRAHRAAPQRHPPAFVPPPPPETTARTRACSRQFRPRAFHGNPDFIAGLLESTDVDLPVQAHDSLTYQIQGIPELPIRQKMNEYEEKRIVGCIINMRSSIAASGLHAHLRA